MADLNKVSPMRSPADGRSPAHSPRKAASPMRSPRNGAGPDQDGLEEEQALKKKKGWFHVDEVPDYGTGFTYDPDYNGPTRNHTCTDVICLGLFIAFLCGWGFVAFFACTEGDINKVIYPTNSKGDICGRGPLADRPYLLFFDLTSCLNPAVIALGCKTTQACVNHCPTEKYSGYAEAMALGGLTDAHVKEKMKPYCVVMSEAKWEHMSAMDLIKHELCPSWVLPSNPVLGRCLPTIVNSGENSNPNATVFGEGETLNNKPLDKGTISGAVNALGYFLSLRSLGERIFNDIAASWWMIGTALLTACFISFFWIVLMRFFAGIMVWTSLSLIFVLFGGLFGYSLFRYIKIKDMPSAQGNIFQVNITPHYMKDALGLADTWLAFSIILGIIFGIILLVLIALRARIAMAIELIEQGSKAVGHMFSTLFFPVLPFLLHLIVVFFFATIALYLSSTGEKEYKIVYYVDEHTLASAVHKTNMRIAPSADSVCPNKNSCVNPKTNETYQIGDACSPHIFNETCPDCPDVSCQFTKYVKAEDASWMQWYNLFGLYWGMFFASALGEMILAGVFARWYFTWDKGDIPCCFLAVSIKNAVFYHLGTVAFGSLIIAIIRMIRTVLSYVESKLKMYNNDLTKCLLCVCQCCLWCLEKFMRFINRNAYIMCAMKSTNFCTSALEAFNLLMRNIMRVLVLNNIVALILFLGKVVIVAGIGCLAYFFFSGGIPDVSDEVPSLNYYFTPIVVIVIGSYWIASSFFGVYAMAVDTLFLCFLEDMERNDGTPARPYYMSKGLQKVVGKMQKFNDDR